MTLQEVKKIQEEYVRGSDNFLCNASPTFFHLWYDAEKSQEIRNLGQEFLTESGISDFSTNKSRLVLFHSIEYSTTEEDVQVRTLFLQWWINKLSQ